LSLLKLSVERVEASVTTQINREIKTAMDMNILLSFLSKLITPSWVKAWIMASYRDRMARMLIEHPDIESVDVKANGDFRFNKYKRVEGMVDPSNQMIHIQQQEQLLEEKTDP
jgi:hypothetical protein